MKLGLMNNLTRGLNRTGLKLKKHSPEILVVTGVVGVVASTVLACKATLKVNEVIEPAKATLEKIHVAAEKGTTEAGAIYTMEDAKKETGIVYLQTGVKLAKLYAPAIVLGVFSVTSILASNNILRKRNVALAAAYTAVDTGFKDYRNRVIERFGEALDKELKYDIKVSEVEETTVDENGNEVVTKKTVTVANPNTYSTYAKFYDDGCIGWEKDAEHNLFFLKCTQNHANDILKTKGHLFLNEVYDMLGIPRTKAGNIVGWIYDEVNPMGDNFVDFGIYDNKSSDFVNGYERVIVLDFNVDGPILDLI